MKINRDNIIFKFCIFLLINIFFVNLDWTVDNMLFTIIFRPILCIVTMKLLGISRSNFKKEINKIISIKNIAFILVTIVVIIIFRIIFNKNIIPILYKEDILVVVLYYLSNFVIASYEEVNFRYIFIDIIGKYIKDNKVIMIISSITFALMHFSRYDNAIFNLTKIACALIFGIGLYYIVKKYGLFQGSIIHFFYNTLLSIYLPTNSSSSIILQVIYASGFLISIIILFRITERILDNKLKNS